MTGTPPENKHLQLRFDVDPLSCVVTLADVLQDFQRPTVEFHSQSEDESCAKYRYEVSSVVVDCEEALQTVRIEYQCVDMAAAVRKRAFLRDEQEEYFEPQVGYLNLSALGVEHVELNAVSL